MARERERARLGDGLQRRLNGHVFRCVWIEEFYRAAGVEFDVGVVVGQKLSDVQIQSVRGRFDASGMDGLIGSAGQRFVNEVRETPGVDGHGQIAGDGDQLAAVCEARGVHVEIAADDLEVDHEGADIDVAVPQNLCLRSVDGKGAGRELSPGSKIPLSPSRSMAPSTAKAPLSIRTSDCIVKDRME